MPQNEFITTETFSRALVRPRFYRVASLVRALGLLLMVCGAARANSITISATSYGTPGGLGDYETASVTFETYVTAIIGVSFPIVGISPCPGLPTFGCDGASADTYTLTSSGTPYTQVWLSGGWYFDQSTGLTAGGSGTVANAGPVPPGFYTLTVASDVDFLTANATAAPNTATATVTAYEFAPPYTEQTISAVPEPSTWLLCGLPVLYGVMRRRTGPVAMVEPPGV